MKTIKQILIERDNMSPEEADDLIAELKARVLEGEDPEELLLGECGLEPDYVFELLEP